jgi:hypothetical protein
MRTSTIQLGLLLYGLIISVSYNPCAQTLDGCVSKWNSDHENKTGKSNDEGDWPPSAHIKLRKISSVAGPSNSPESKAAMQRPPAPLPPDLASINSQHIKSDTPQQVNPIAKNSTAVSSSITTLTQLIASFQVTAFFRTAYSYYVHKTCLHVIMDMLQMIRKLLARGAVSFLCTSVTLHYNAHGNRAQGILALL